MTLIFSSSLPLLPLSPCSLSAAAVLFICRPSSACASCPSYYSRRPCLHHARWPTATSPASHRTVPVHASTLQYHTHITHCVRSFFSFPTCRGQRIRRNLPVCSRPPFFNPSLGRCPLSSSRCQLAPSRHCRMATRCIGPFARYFNLPYTSSSCFALPAVGSSCQLAAEMHVQTGVSAVDVVLTTSFLLFLHDPVSVVGEPVSTRATLIHLHPHQTPPDTHARHQIRARD